MVLNILCLLLGAFLLFHTSASEIPEGCFVRNEISEENLQFGTLDFLVFNSNMKIQNTNILLSCSHGDYDLINIGSSQLTLQRFRSQTEVMKGSYSAHDMKDWNGFQLGLLENLTLHDADNNSWLPTNLSLDCPIKNVKISQGFFTRFCPERIPTWKVPAGKEQEIPLLSKMQRQRLTLISMKPFKPSFIICGTVVQLGSSNGKMVTGTSVDVLPSGHQELILEVISESQSHSLKVLDGNGNTVHTSPLKEAPTKLKFKGRHSDNFLIVQHLGEPDQEQEEETPNPGNHLQLSVASSIIGLFLLIQLVDALVILKLVI